MKNSSNQHIAIKTKDLAEDLFSFKGIYYYKSHFKNRLRKFLYYLLAVTGIFSITSCWPLYYHEEGEHHRHHERGESNEHHDRDRDRDYRGNDDHNYRDRDEHHVHHDDDDHAHDEHHAHDEG